MINDNYIGGYNEKNSDCYNDSYSMLLYNGMWTHSSNDENSIAENDKNQIIFLCESQSGRYKVYGFVTPKYGTQGILIDNIIDGDSNTNYFCEKWFYTEEQPTIMEAEDFYEVVLRICDEKNREWKEIYFDTFNTGTMWPRNDWMLE